ncbi:MAG: FecR domain-containing protein [Tannerellaceae bacterium]|jgi:ferric-dicitrate binding protein FerR (iron transport regulator)|nr:FecR domain-containing protein [Tannerellaceae bacterium]
MTQPTHNNTNTDLAWRRLYLRLEQEDLIPAPASAISPRPRRLRLAEWSVAAGAACCAGIIALALLTNNESAPPPLLSLHNEKEGVTLVTTLEDGSIVYLAAGAHLRYPERFAPGKREVSLSGNALFDVQGNRRRPFLIQTEAAQVEVTGTIFHLQSAGARSFQLSVKEGEVEVTSRRPQRLHAAAGQTILLTSSGDLRVEPAATDNIFNPYDGQLRFKDEKLADILRIINSQGAGAVLQTTASLSNRKITVTFADATPEKVAELICVAFDLLCKKENNTLLITEP